MKIILQLIVLILIIPEISFAQRILTLEDALAIALKESYGIKSAEYSLISRQKTLEAVELGLKTSINMEFDLPRYSRTLSSQFNPLTGIEEFFAVGYTTLESRLFFSQPIVFSNGNFSLVGSLWRRNQFKEGQNIPIDYYSNLSLRLRQPIFAFNSLSASLLRAEINSQISERNYTRAEKEIIYSTTAGFYRLYQAKKNVEITKEKVNQTEISYNTAINKFKAGLIAEVEALQLEVDLASSKNELLNSERNFTEGKDEFKLLVGLQLEEEIDVIAELDYYPIKVDVTTAIDYALANRSELLNSKSDIELRNISVDEVDSRGNISALVTANFGINKNDNTLRDIFRDFAEDRSLIFTLSIPVLDWGRNRREVESASADLDLAYLNYQNQKQQIQKEIIAIINKLESAKARVDVLSKSVEVAQKSYDISLARFRAGTITSFDLSQIQLRLTDAKINSLSALIDYKLSVADLARKTLHDFDNK